MTVLLKHFLKKKVHTIDTLSRVSLPLSDWLAGDRVFAHLPSYGEMVLCFLFICLESVGAHAHFYSLTYSVLLGLFCSEDNLPIPQHL